jgi:putative transposase
MKAPSTRETGSRKYCTCLVQGYVEHYNNVRLNSAIGYITPKDMLAGHQQDIQAERDRKLEAAREQRKNHRQRAA